MPRAGLDTETVVAAAAALADADGLDAVTLARLASHLGVRPPSLYVHVGGVADLHQRLAARGARDLAAQLQVAAAGRSRGDALAAVADAYRTYAREHPGTYASTQRTTNLETTDAQAAATVLLDTVLAVLRGYGLTDEDGIHATRAVRAALHGFVSLETGDGFGMPQDLDESFQTLIAVLDQGLRARAVP